MTRKHAVLALAFALLTALVALPALAGEKPVSGTVAVNEVTAVGTVEAIDLATRTVTLKGEGGRVESFEVDPAAKNLDQVKVGDVLTIVYKESLVYEVNKSGSAQPGLEGAAVAGTAKPGEKPALAAGRQVTATVTITQIDPTVPSVTFKGPAGNERTFKVKDPKKLESVKVGDLVDITYTEALAISVEPGKKK